MSTSLSRRYGAAIKKTGRRYKAMSLISSALAVGALTLVSCSGEDLVNSSNQSPELGVMNYFPVDVGYSASFVVSDGNGVEIRRESYSADSAVLVDGHRGVSWVQRDLADSSVINRGVMHWNSDRSILFHTADSSQNVERLLRLPLSASSNWPRWHEPSISDGGSHDDPGSGLGDGSAGDNGLDTGSNGSGLGNGISDDSNPLLTSFPTKGMSIFHVAALDDQVSVNGKLYSDCLVIVNANTDNTVNRYWYCQGVGLVKYALNVTFGESSGSVNGSIL